MVPATRHLQYGEGLEPAQQHKRGIDVWRLGERLYFQTSKRNPDYSTYKCRRTHEAHREGAPSASVIARNAEAHVESLFLNRFGDQQGVVVYWQDSHDDRTEAVSIAKVGLKPQREP